MTGRQGAPLEMHSVIRAAQLINPANSLYEVHWSVALDTVAVSIVSGGNIAHLRSDVQEV